MSQTLDTTTPTARKTHWCSLCYRQIQPGERYERQSNIGDDGLYTWKECAHCTALVAIIGWRTFADEWADGGYTPEGVLDWEPETIAHLRLKALWLKKWTRRDGTLHPIPDDQP